MVVLPRITQPASRSRAAGGASAACPGASSLARVPIGDGSPRVQMFSLMVSGTPSSGERAVPARQRAAEAPACSSAPSRSMRYMALIFGSHASMRASRARVTSSGEISPRAYADDSASADRSVMENPLYTAREDDKKAVDRSGGRVHLPHGAGGG